MVGERTSKGDWYGLGVVALMGAAGLGWALGNTFSIKDNKSEIERLHYSDTVMNARIDSLADTVVSKRDFHTLLDSVDALEFRFFQEMSHAKGEIAALKVQYSDLAEGRNLDKERVREVLEVMGRTIESNARNNSALETKVDSLHAPEKVEAEVSYVDSTAVLNSAYNDLMNQIALDLDSKIIPHNDSLGGTGGGRLGHFFRNWNPLDRFTKDGKITKDGNKSLTKYLASLDLNSEVDSLVYDVAFDSTKNVSGSTIKRISSEVYQEVLNDTKYKTRGIRHSDLSK